MDPIVAKKRHRGQVELLVLRDGERVYDGLFSELSRSLRSRDAHCEQRSVVFQTLLLASEDGPAFADNNVCLPKSEQVHLCITC